MKPTTPFPLSGYYGPDYFCDRMAETQQVIQNIYGGQSTVLSALRRMGKTALIKHIQHNLQKERHTIYLDILNTENEMQFLESFATSIVQSISEKSSFGKNIWDFIKGLRPVLQYDSLTGHPQISFDSTREAPQKHISSILGFLGEKKKYFLIAIDEFQQITNYPEKKTDAWLRSVIQQLNNVQFIFSGSHQHLINNLFSDPERPFYRSASFLKIGRINEEEYNRFISQKFKEAGMDISDEIISEMISWTNCHTYYVQLLCNRVFLTKIKTITSDTWRTEAANILKENEPIFFQYRDLLSKGQWQLLKAIAMEGKVYNITSQQFIQKHALGSSASVLRSLNTLYNKEIIYKDYDPTGSLYYGVYDVLFERWIGA